MRKGQKGRGVRKGENGSLPKSDKSCGGGGIASERQSIKGTLVGINI